MKKKTVEPIQLYLKEGYHTYHGPSFTKVLDFLLFWFNGLFII